MAARFALPVADTGDTDAMELMAALCAFRGADEEARTWRRRAEPIVTARRMHSGDLFDLVEKARATSDHTTHGDLADQAVSLADALSLENRHDEAVSVLRESLEHESLSLQGRTSEPLTMSRLVEALRRAGRAQQAAQVEPAQCGWSPMVPPSSYRGNLIAIYRGVRVSDPEVAEAAFGAMDIDADDRLDWAELSAHVRGLFTATDESAKGAHMVGGD
ncbi:hypothetical protein [Saccharothrix sp. Mg75]|uniref:hypothetical protein n=1 Tax=Saccharothrix sp. Mg75 TaxID=3445357 RepID=UPI003EEF3D77